MCADGAEGLQVATGFGGGEVDDQGYYAEGGEEGEQDWCEGEDDGVGVDAWDVCGGECSESATIPPTSVAIFTPAFAPLSVGTLNWSWARVVSPASSARRMIGTKPDADTRFGSSNDADTAAGV